LSDETPLGDLPKPPEKPDDDSCCGNGCDPCVFDIYERALARWADRVRALGHDPDEALKRLGA
jgi:hypothetical protein